MQIEKVKISKLSPAEYNPRVKLQHGDAEYEKLKRSIETFGYIDPIIINADGTIIGGHQRYFILQELGYDEIDVVKLDLDENDERALNVALNNISGNWDEEKLKELLKGLKLDEYDFTVTGFGEEELDALIADLELPDIIEEDDYDVDAELKKTDIITKRGDIWILGRHRLVCGDSTKADTFDKLMDGKSANLVITDPPYNVNYEANAGKIQNDNMGNNEFYHFLLDAFKNTERIMADDASIYVFHADTEGLNFRRAFDDAGFYLSGCCIWKKQSLVLGRSPYQWQHEPVLYGWKKKGKHKWYTGRKETTIWEFDKPQRSKDHPMMKPIPLLAYPIGNSSSSNSIVVDPFGGSGSTMIACEQTNRSCYMIELDERFCDIIVRRWEEFTGEKAVRL